MGNRKFTEDVKHEVVRLRLAEGRTYQSITDEWGVSRKTISAWCTQFSEECQSKAQTNPEYVNEAESMGEILKLRKENDELKKEVLFLKKAAAFFAREID